MRKGFLFISLALASVVVAKEMPQDSKVLAANHNAIVAQASDTLHVPISLKHANRISVKGGRIERFVSDPAQLEIRHDAQSGALFVVPLTTEAAPLYIVTQSGTTHALMLSPKDKIGAQNLEVREPTATATNPELSLTGLPTESAVQEIFRMLPVITAGESQRLKSSVEKTAEFEIRPLRQWQVSGLTLRKSLITARKGKTKIQEAAFWKPGILAVASEFSELKGGASGRLWTIHGRNTQ